MNIRIQQVCLETASEQEEREIDKVLEASQSASLFHSIHWNRLLIEEFKLKNVSLLAKDDEKPVAFYTFYEDIGAGSKRLHSPYLRYQSFYGAPVAVPGHERAIPELLKASEEIAKGGIWSLLTPPNYPKELLAEAGYRCVESFTSIVDLRKGADELFGGIKKTTQRAIRKALKSGVSFTEGDSRDFDKFYSTYKSWTDVLNEKLERKLFLLPEQFCHRLWEALSKRNQAFMLVGRLNGAITNASLQLCYKDTIYAWILATSYEFRPYKVDSLLYWEVMQWGREHGYGFLDLCDLDLPSPEKSKRMDFKRAFGGEDCIFHVAKKEPKSLYWHRLCFYLSHPSRLTKRLWQYCSSS